MPKDPTSMHEDHRQARSDHAAWLDEIVHWRIEHRKALAMLSRVEGRLYDHEVTLEEHMMVIQSHDRRIQEQERALAEAVRSGDPELPEDLVAQHQTSEAEHARARELHEGFKQSHRHLMAELQRLLKAMQEQG